MPWGLIPVSAFAQRALTVICPPDPHLRGYLTGGLALASGGFEHKILHSSCLGDTGPYPV